MAGERVKLARLGLQGGGGGNTGTDDLPSETKALLSCFLDVGRRMSFHSLNQAGSRSHCELHFAFEVCDRVECHAVMELNGCEVSIRREDAHATGKAPQVSARRSVLVVLRDIHRVKPDGVPPVPAELVGERLIEDGKPVVHSSAAS